MIIRKTITTKNKYFYFDQLLSSSKKKSTKTLSNNLNKIKK